MSEAGCRVGYVTLPVRNLSVNIECPFETVAIFLGDPLNFPAWATGLSSGLAPAADDAAAEPGEWIAAAPEGKAYVRFTPTNPFGVADHRVRFPNGPVLDIPIRAIRNGTARRWSSLSSAGPKWTMRNSMQTASGCSAIYRP